ncbi:hypothetical protein IW262DRAFT_1420286 [Armillaria fumosa]|nr:hypothetical protein IW262DRAFT_1420286 [Armillaria fumosa]
MLKPRCLGFCARLLSLLYLKCCVRAADFNILLIHCSINLASEDIPVHNSMESDVNKETRLGSVAFRLFQCRK